MPARGATALSLEACPRARRQWRRPMTRPQTATRIQSDAATDRGPTNGAHVAVNGHAIERPRPSAKEVKAKKKIIARKYKLQRLQRDPDANDKAVTGRRPNET